MQQEISFPPGWWISGCPRTSSTSKLENRRGKEQCKEWWYWGQEKGSQRPDAEQSLVCQSARKEQQLRLRKRTIANQQDGSPNIKLPRDNAIMTRSWDSVLEKLPWRRESFLWEQLPSVTSLLCDNSEIQWRGDVNQNIQRSIQTNTFWTLISIKYEHCNFLLLSEQCSPSCFLCSLYWRFSSQRHSSCELCVGKYFFALALQSHSCLSSCHWKRDKLTMTHFWNIT